MWVLLSAGCTSPNPGDAPARPSLGADATLRALSLSDAVLSPPFSPDTTAYAVRAEALADPVTVVATPTDPDASVAVRQTTLVDEALGEGTVLALDAAEKVAVDVVSADGSATRTYTVVTLPADFPELVTRTTGTPSPGGVFLASAAPDPVLHFAMVVDRNGVPSWFSGFPKPVWDFRPSPRGNATLVTSGDSDWTYVGLRLDPSFAETARWVPAPLADAGEVGLDVHELFELADGGRVMLGLAAEPRDLSPWGGPVDGRILHSVVEELDPDGEVRFAWTTDGAIDLDRVPVWVWEPKYGAWDPAHVNAVSVDPTTGHWVVSARLTSQVFEVARTETVFRGRTFAPGEILWRLGGADADLAFVDDPRAGGTRGFFGQHSARILPDGHLVVYDNAVRRVDRGTPFLAPDIALTVTGGSRFADYALDFEAMTATLVSERERPEPEFTQAGGSVQRLEDGHTLVGWGDLPEQIGGPAVTELDADGTVVWELDLPSGEWSYRAWSSVP